MDWRRYLGTMRRGEVCVVTTKSSSQAELREQLLSPTSASPSSAMQKPTLEGGAGASAGGGVEDAEAKRGKEASSSSSFMHYEIEMVDWYDRKKVDDAGTLLKQLVKPVTCSSSLLRSPSSWSCQ